MKQRSPTRSGVVRSETEAASSRAAVIVGDTAGRCRPRLITPTTYARRAPAAICYSSNCNTIVQHLKATTILCPLPISTLNYSALIVVFVVGTFEHIRCNVLWYIEDVKEVHKKFPASRARSSGNPTPAPRASDG